MGGENKIGGLKKKPPVSLPALQGPFPLHLHSGWACAAVWVGGHDQAEQGMKNACLLACLRASCSEPSSTQAGVGRAHASALNELQDSALHLNSQLGPIQAPGVLAGLLVMPARSSSMKTRILP